MKQLALLSVLLFGACQDSSIHGATGIIAFEGRPLNSQGVCFAANVSQYYGDLAVIFLAKYSYLVSHFYDEVGHAAEGIRICIVPVTEDCGGELAMGCAAQYWVWVAAIGPDGKPLDLAAIIAHELTHLISERLGIPASNAHTEPAFTIWLPQAVRRMHMEEDVK